MGGAARRSALPTLPGATTPPGRCMSDGIDVISIIKSINQRKP
jgi:hypothetical protein